MEKAMNEITWKQKLESYKKHPMSALLLIVVFAAAIITFAVLFFIVVHILYKGVPHLSLDMFAWNYTRENVSMMPAIINTLTMVGLTLLLAVPIGVFCAIYLVEYAKKGNKLVAVIRLTTETLSGIPSIVYGLFGFLMFGVALKWGYTMLGGSLTLAIMILPLVIRTTEEALLAVPDLFREGSFGLGAGKLRTIFKVVLPSAVPGILSGVILSIGRIIGETAALIYTSGTVAGVPDTLMGSGRTLAIHMYALLSEGLYTNQAYATAVVILVVVIIINILAGYVAKKVGVKNE